MLSEGHHSIQDNYLRIAIKKGNIFFAIGGHFLNIYVWIYVISIVALQVISFNFYSIFKRLKEKIFKIFNIAKGEFIVQNKLFYIFLFFLIAFDVFMSTVRRSFERFLKKCIFDAVRFESQSIFHYLNVYSLNYHAVKGINILNEDSIDMIFEIIDLISHLIVFIIAIIFIMKDREINARNEVDPKPVIDNINMALISACSILFFIGSYFISKKLKNNNIHKSYEDCYTEIAEHAYLINRFDQLKYASKILDDRFKNNDLKYEKNILISRILHFLLLSIMAFGMFFDFKRSGIINRFNNDDHAGENTELLFYLNAFINQIIYILFVSAELINYFRHFKSISNIVDNLLYDEIPNKIIDSFKYFSLEFNHINFNVKSFEYMREFFDDQEGIDEALTYRSIIHVKELIKKQKDGFNKKILQEFYDDTTLLKECDVKVYHNGFTFVENGIEYSIKFDKKLLMCVTGDSASGKTTFIKLLFGISKFSQAESKINGINIEEVKVSELSKCVGVILQKPYMLYNFTPREIFRLFGATNDEKIKQQLLRFEIYNKIIQNMDSYIKDIKLSGGETFRLAFSFFYASDGKPTIFVIDECLSALDKNSQKRILETLVNENELNSDGTRGSAIIHIEHLGLFKDMSNFHLHIQDKKLNFHVRVNGQFVNVIELMKNHKHLVADNCIITAKRIDDIKTHR